MLDSINSSGHSYAKSWAASHLSQAHVRYIYVILYRTIIDCPMQYVSEVWDGITQFNLIQDIVANIDEGSLDKVSDALNVSLIGLQ
jgi:Zn-dependent M16 (insulinase) family peptidase